MTKAQMMTEILKIYDENEALKRATEKADRPILVAGKDKAANPTAQLDALCKARGFDSVFRTCLDYYYDSYPCVAVKAADDGSLEADAQKMGNFLTFDQWFTAVSKRTLQNADDSMFNSLSFDQVKEYFKEQLKKVYGQLVDKKKGEILKAAKDAK